MCGDTLKNAMLVDQITTTDVRMSALNLLARREHSRHELKHKLSKRYPHFVGIEQVLDELTQENLQSDTRFVQSYVNYRCRQGKGPIRIAYELRERGVEDSLVESCVDAHAKQWFDLIADVRAKRFGPLAPMNMASLARQKRFLQYRGFTNAQIQQLFKSHS